MTSGQTYGNYRLSLIKNENNFVTFTRSDCTKLALGIRCTSKRLPLHSCLRCARRCPLTLSWSVSLRALSRLRQRDRFRWLIWEEWAFFLHNGPRWSDPVLGSCVVINASRHESLNWLSGWPSIRLARWEYGASFAKHTGKVWLWTFVCNLANWHKLQAKEETKSLFAANR